MLGQPVLWLALVVKCGHYRGPEGSGTPLKETTEALAGRTVCLTFLQ